MTAVFHITCFIVSSQEGDGFEVPVGACQSPQGAALMMLGNEVKRQQLCERGPGSVCLL